MMSDTSKDAVVVWDDPNTGIEWVEAEQYRALSAERDALQAKMDRAKSYVMRMAAQDLRLGSGADFKDAFCHAVRDARATLKELTTDPERETQ